VSVRIAYAALEMLEANRYVTRPTRFQCYRVTWQPPSEGERRPSLAASSSEPPTAGQDKRLNARSHASTARLRLAEADLVEMTTVSTPGLVPAGCRGQLADQLIAAAGGCDALLRCGRRRRSQAVRSAGASRGPASSWADPSRGRRSPPGSGGPRRPKPTTVTSRPSATRSRISSRAHRRALILIGRFPAEFAGGHYRTAREMVVAR